MSVPAVITYIGLTMIVAALISFFLAKVKRRNGDGWAFASFLFPPLLIVLLLLPKAELPYEVQRDEKRRKHLFSLLGD